MSVWDTYEQDVDDLERQGEEQNEILEKAGLSDADSSVQDKYMEDYWADVREREDMEWDKQQHDLGLRE